MEPLKLDDKEYVITITSKSKFVTEKNGDVKNLAKSFTMFEPKWNTRYAEIERLIKENY